MPAGTLKQTIRGMLKDARAQPGLPIVRSLGGIFTLTITQIPSGVVQAELARTNTAPTEIEWGRILTQWPEAVPANVTPRPRTEGRRHALIGSWPRPAEVGERNLN